MASAMAVASAAANAVAGLGEELKGLGRLVMRQREQIEEVREDCKALVDCLAARGVMTAPSYLAELHRRRFDAVLRAHPCQWQASFRDIVQEQRLILHLVEYTGFASVQSIQAVTRLTSKRVAPSSREVTQLFPEDLVVVGGTDGEKCLSQAERFRPARGTWEPLPPMAEPRSGAAATVCFGKLLVWGGYDGLAFHQSVECYDPTMAAWEAAGSITAARGGLCAAVMDSRVYLFGGYDGVSASTSAERLCANFRAWEALPPLREPRSGAVAAVLGGKIYVCGGHHSDRTLNSMERFNPFSLTWQAMPPMRECRRDAAAAVLAGRVYVCGGFNGEIFIVTLIMITTVVSRGYRATEMRRAARSA
eukprot:gnl/TRDRNA2_/TRDRNA2_87258_c0_seq1.p1 gnl/TRDRNA2_/TRDRNA2_87258_c0~~gnl/TRDRNA2_/TRDRNA2_87258_c0_seq1.p1  ORF type:complete len:378 (+),score=64.46 gnl/TRDRNA2_/TRDRNA2_87258_c0_seq1:46-1134(+)